MKVAIAFIAMISLTVMANLLLKVGAAVPSGAGLAFLLNWRTIGGLASFGAAGLLYAVVLRWVPLNVAVSFLAAQYIAVLLASWVILDERIAGPQWLGVAFIASGIVITGWSQR